MTRAPGRRVPRTVDGDELAVRAVLGQQISTAAARTHAGRLAAALGEPVADPDGRLDRLFPSPAASSRWRPWRAYAVQHLWALGDHPVNHLPAGTDRPHPRSSP